MAQLQSHHKLPPTFGIVGRLKPSTVDTYGTYAPGQDGPLLPRVDRDSNVVGLLVRVGRPDGVYVGVADDIVARRERRTPRRSELQLLGGTSYNA